MRRLYPYEQGNLDGLCGFYSIINAVIDGLSRTEPAERRDPKLRRRLSQKDAEALFVHLVRELWHHKPKLNPVIDGVNAADLARLLRTAGAWLEDRFEMQLRFHRPFYHRSRMSSGHLIPHLARHLSQPRNTSIVGTQPPYAHWTVISKVSRAQALLFDSGGRCTMPIGGSRKAAPLHVQTICRSSVFLIGLYSAR